MTDDNVIFLTSNTSWYLYNFRKSTITSLIESGYKPVCLAPYDEYSEKLIELGAEFVALNLEGKSTNPWKEVVAFFNVIKVFKRFKPKFVFNFTIKMNIYAGLCCRLLGIPYSNNVSGLGTTFLHSGLAYSIAKRLYGLSNYFARTIFFQNIEDMSLFIDKKLVNKDKATLLPGSGVNVDEFPFKSLNTESSNRTFLMIARVIADKGVREYVEAANYVKRKYPDTRFLLVGDWNISNKTAFDESIIKSWKETSAVQFLGHQDDVRSWIYQSDILVLPSYREGMPRTVLEAASCGRPAIVSNVPGCRHAIKVGVTGWLCDVKSSESLADSMINCIKLSASELGEYGKMAREHIEKNFSDSIVINHYMKLLKEPHKALVL